MKGKALSTLTIFLLFSFIIIQYSNEANPNEPTPNEKEIVLAEEVKQTDRLNFKDNLILIDSTKIIFLSSSDYAANVKIGDIMVSNFVDGVIRKVTNIIEDNERLIFETRIARLYEVIVKGKISYKGPLDLSKAQLINASENILRIKSLQIKFPSVLHELIWDLEIS